MNNPKLKRGKRGGRSDRPSRVFRPMAKEHRNSKSTAALVADAAPLYEISHTGQPIEGRIVDKSLTAVQHIGWFEQRIETEPVVSRQLDKVSGAMVAVTDNRVVYRSDRTLLQRGKPLSSVGSLKRTGAIRQGQNVRKFVKPVEDVTERQSVPYIYCSIHGSIPVDSTPADCKCCAAAVKAQHYNADKLTYYKTVEGDDPDILGVLLEDVELE